MKTSGLDILAARRRNQLLLSPPAKTPSEIVAWLGAVQSQDYAGAKWALGLRNPRLTDAASDEAFNRGDILRTHVLRPTWHFVAAADLRWILALSGPRVHAVNGPYYRANEIDAALMSRARRVFERALADGPKTRTDLATALKRAGIDAAGLRLAYIVMHAELDAVLCSGPRQGKQFTYALADERAPRSDARPRAEGLLELTRRYFRSHGPATLRDFSWWSGLTIGDIKHAVTALGRDLESREYEGRTYWSAAGCEPVEKPGKRGRRAHRDALLLPNYDESLIAYRDRQLHVAPRPPGATAFPPLPHQLVVDGLVVGGWRRLDAGKGVQLDVAHDRVSCTPVMLEVARQRLAAFLERPVTLTIA